MKKKLNLKSLEVQSFVTSLESDSSMTVKGGHDTTRTVQPSNLPTMPCNCSAVDGCLTAWNCTNIPEVC